MRMSKKDAIKCGFILPENRRQKSKYGNIITYVDGYCFASKAEAKYYTDVIKPRLKKGEITDLVIHPRFSLEVNGRKICTVVFDFQYFDKALDEVVIDDVKGADNEKSKRKRQHFEAQYNKKVNIIFTKKKKSKIRKNYHA